MEDTVFLVTILNDLGEDTTYRCTSISAAVKAVRGHEDFTIEKKTLTHYCCTSYPNCDFDDGTASGCNYNYLNQLEYLCP